MLQRVPTTLTLYDIARDGRVLVEQQDLRQGAFARPPGEDQDRELSTLDAPGVSAISEDGKLLLISETGEAGGDTGSVYLRRTDGSAPVLLGPGVSGGISSDGVWAAACSAEGTKLILYPTGAGKPRSVETHLQGMSRPAFISGSLRIIIRASETGHRSRLYVVDASTGAFRAISEEGIPYTSHLVSSPDGTRVLGLGTDFRPTIYPLSGGPAIPVAGGEPRESPAGWSADGRTVYVYHRAGGATTVFRVDLTTGKRELWKTITAPDPAGVTGVAPVCVVMDGKSYAYGVTRILSTLYLADGVK
jgi:hypothetical protein